MLRHRENISGSRLFKQLNPFLGVEPVRRKHRNKVLVSKILLLAVRLAVPLPFFLLLEIHISRIPFTAMGRDTVKPPVNEYAELGAMEPWRGAPLAQGIPVCLKLSLLCDSINFFQSFLLSFQIFHFYCFLPD